VCTNFTPTKRAQWVKESLGVDLPSGYPDEAYPGYAAPLVVKSHQTGRVACGLAKFGLFPSWVKDDKISRHTYNARSETAAEKPSYQFKKAGIMLSEISPVTRQQSDLMETAPAGNQV